MNESGGLSTQIKILLVDDHVLVRKGLRMIIEGKGKSGMRVVGETGDPAEACALAEREQPDIVLLDVDLGPHNGIDLLPALLAASPGTRAILLTGSADPDTHHSAVQHGAVGVILKDKAPEVLLKAIEKVNGGEIWLDRSMIGRVFAGMSGGGRKASDPEAEKIAQLTPREREVIELIGQGLKNKVIAERLFISEVTVRHHLTSIYSKLDVSDRLELIIYAYQHKLAKPLI